MVSKFPQKFEELRCNVISCDQAVNIETTSKNIKKWQKNGNSYLIFEVFFILTAWSQYLTLEPNCIKDLWNFETIHRSKSVFIVKRENFSANGSGCSMKKIFFVESIMKFFFTYIAPEWPIEHFHSEPFALKFSHFTTKTDPDLWVVSKFHNFLNY